jgi:hypothetical protein
MPNGDVYLAGTFRLIDLTTARVYFDDTTYFTGINLASSVNAATYGFVAWIDSTDGSLIAHQVDSAEADVTSPNGVYMWQRNNSGTLLNGLTTSDYAQTIRDYGGGVSPFASSAGVMHFAAKYGSATTTADLLLDYGNTDLFMVNASNSGNQSGLLAARSTSGVDWASALIEPNRTGATVNDKVFCAVWTFEDGSCIALGKGLMNNAASQNAQIERFPSAITPVPIVSDLPYGVAVRYDVSGNVVWTARFIEYGAVFGPTLGGGGWFNLYDCWYDEQRDLLHFTLSQAVTTSLTINPDTTPVVLNTSPAAEKGFVLSMDPSTGEITHADNIFTAANGVCYPCRVVTNPITGLCYVGIGNSSTTAASTNLFPASSSPIEILDLNNNGALHLAEFEPTVSPATPVTNPYTPTRVVEVASVAQVITPNFRAVKPITTTTVYDRAAQYYEFYSRRVAAAGGTIVDPAATLAFVEFCVEEGIWTKLSAAFLPFAGLTAGGGGEVTTWFNLHGADVAETGAARPIWTASDANFNGLPSVDFNGTAQRLLATTAAVNLSRTALFSASEYEMFSVFRADAINTAGALSSSMDQLIYCGIAGLGLNSTPTAGLWSNDGVTDSAGNAISLSTTYLVSGRHEGGSIYSAINAGAESSAVSGDVGLTTLQLYLGNNASTAWFDGQISSGITCRSGLTAGQRAALKAYIMELYALA